LSKKNWQVNNLYDLAIVLVISYSKVLDKWKK